MRKELRQFANAYPRPQIVINLSWLVEKIGVQTIPHSLTFNRIIVIFK